MIEWLVEPFESAFMQRALLAGFLAVVTTSVIGTWVVLRGLSFMGDALAHGVLPGVAFAFLLGFDLTLGAALGAVAMVAGISLVSRRTTLAEDTSIGLLFVGMLALGVIVISRAPSFAGDLTAILFGDILGVDTGDLWIQAIAALLTLVGTAAFFRAFLVLCFNEDKAALLGLRPALAHAAMLTLVAVAVVSSFRAVGALLVFGLLIAPPATASLIVRRVPAMMLAAVLQGSVSVVTGLLVSFHLDTAASASVAGVSVACFFVVLIVREIATRFTHQRA